MAVDEIIRILKPGGKGLIYVWALEQERNNEKSNYLKGALNTNCRNSELAVNNGTFSMEQQKSQESLPIHVNRTQFKAQDLLVPWHLRKKEDNTELSDESDIFTSDNCVQCSGTFLRYYHVFVEGELEKLIKSSQHTKEVNIVESYYDKGNWCVIFDKL